jgi:hypothetical protein
MMTSSDEQPDSLAAAWHQAAADLGIRVVAPFTVTSGESSYTFPLCLPDFGGSAGMVCGTLETPSEQTRAAERAGYYVSLINPRIYGHYVREEFISILDDWQYFGPPAQCPAWYAAHRWRHASPQPG